MDQVQPVKTMRIDLHCHSEVSWDCITPLALLPGRCRERGITVQAVTDHNEIWGAQRLKAMVENGDNPLVNVQTDQEANPLTIIVGEEISTSEGELIGLFLNQKIEPGLSPEETVQRIKDQGGLVLLPHGFDPLKRRRLRPEARERIAASIDIVESFNTRVSRPRWNDEAVGWARERGLVMSAGSDAHTLADIGSAWVEAPAQPISGPDDLLRVLAGGQPTGAWTQPAVAFLYKAWDFLRRKL
jgi:predicted metal-dependent phosphoesterase TrpH